MQATLRAPATRIFAAWTSGGGLNAWMARDVFVNPEEGQHLEGVTFDTKKELKARFERIEPDRHLRMTWSEGGLRGLLGISLWPAEEGVVLSLTLRSFALMEGERPIIQALWEKRFERLAAYFERPPLEKPLAGQGRLTVSRDFEATPARLWNALTDAALMRRWLVDWTDFEPRVGAPFVFLWKSYGEDRGKVKEVRPGELIRYTWDLPELNETTEVVFRIKPEPGNPGVCRVELEHTGWGEGADWDRQREAHESGWSGVLALLDFYFRHGAGKERRGFHVRRRVALPLDRAVALMTTSEGLRSWVSERASLDLRVGGVFECDVTGGETYRGRIAAIHPSGDATIELDAPGPAILEWGFAPDGKGTRMGVTLTSYSGSPEWLEERRREWATAMDKLPALP